MTSRTIREYQIPSIIFKPANNGVSAQAPPASTKTEQLSVGMGQMSNLPPIPSLTDKECSTCTLNRGLSLATWTWIILIPIIVFVLLIWLAPQFVTDDTPEEDKEINYGAIILWTIIITIIIWASVFAFNKCCIK